MPSFCVAVSRVRGEYVRSLAYGMRIYYTYDCAVRIGEADQSTSFSLFLDGPKVSQQTVNLYIR